MMTVKLLNIKLDVTSSTHTEEKINKALEERDIYIGQVINIQYLSNDRIVIFYREN